MIALIVESVGRSLMIFAAVVALISLLRVRSASIQIAAWRIALVAALAMPALMQLRVVSVPLDAEVSAVLTSVAARADQTTSQSWIGVLAYAYTLLSIALLTKLAAGLIASWRLRFESTPMRGCGLAGKPARISSSIAAPVTVGSTILLPPAYSSWRPDRLLAALAHEGEHVRGGDFYWHVAALLHRAIFWINPFAWWLPKHLAALTETRADETAANAVGDPVEYAQMLLEFSKKTQSIRIAMGMAQSADVSRRVERLLSGDSQTHSPSRRSRILTIVSTIAVASVLACASCVHQRDIIVKPYVDAGGLSQPPYDPATRRAEIQGTVFVNILVDVDGRVTDVKLHKSSGNEVLDNATLNEARTNWRLYPGTRNGKAEAMWVTVPVVFKIT